VPPRFVCNSARVLKHSQSFRPHSRSLTGAPLNSRGGFQFNRQSPRSVRRLSGSSIELTLLCQRRWRDYTRRERSCQATPADAIIHQYLSCARQLDGMRWLLLPHSTLSARDSPPASIARSPRECRCRAARAANWERALRRGWRERRRCARAWRRRRYNREWG